MVHRGHRRSRPQRAAGSSHVPARRSRRSSPSSSSSRTRSSPTRPTATSTSVALCPVRPAVGRARRGDAGAGAERQEGGDQRDFALWKAQKPGEDAAWESPWGPGRPGWHIECSAMAEKFLGTEFELRRRNDLRFPHHENERAQSSSLGHPFAAGLDAQRDAQLDEAKMSKSLGNVVTLRNVLGTGVARRCSSSTCEELAQAGGLRRRGASPGGGAGRVVPQRLPRAVGGAPPAAWDGFAAALEDDFNTPDALAVMHEWRVRPAAACAGRLRARVAGGRGASPPTS